MTKAVISEGVEVIDEKAFACCKQLTEAKVPSSVTGEKKVTATYKAMHYGTPSYSDFKGVQGEMFVLLKK